MATSRTLNILNDNGSLNFSSGGEFTSTLSNLDLNSTGSFRILGDTASLIKVDSANSNVEVINGHLNLISSKQNSNGSIYMEATGTAGGIKMRSKSSGIDLYSTGNVDLNSVNKNINIGVFTNDITKSTDKIILESATKISMDTEDIDIVASDSINIISQTSDIKIGTSPSNTLLGFQNNNILLNQSSSTSDRQLDIKITDVASSTSGKNGIIVNSDGQSSIGSDIILQSSTSNGILSLGIEPLLNTSEAYQTYQAIQPNSTSIISLSGDLFTENDIGRKVHWVSTNQSDTIQSIGGYITSTSNSYANSLSLTTSGTWTGGTLSATKLYKVIIDSTGTPDTFRWSNDKGNTFQTTYQPVVSGAIALENGISITFEATTGHVLNDYWTFQVLPSATVSTSRNISSASKLISIKPFDAYLKTSNASDIKMITNNSEKMRITNDGNIGIGTQRPTSSLTVSSNVQKILAVNDYNSNYQINPTVDHFTQGGYVVSWEDATLDGNNYGVYAQVFLSNGDKYGDVIAVNKTTTNNQSHPSIACTKKKNSSDFAIVWTTEVSSGSYDIYANIFENRSHKKTADIHITVGYSSNQQIQPKIVGLANGNYLITWATQEGSESDYYDIYARILDVNGNVGSLFQITNGDSKSQLYPYPISISSNDANISGGAVIAYMEEYASGDTRYNIKYARLSISSTTISRPSADTVVTSTSNATLSDGLVRGVGLDNGGFILSFYRNFEAYTANYNSGTFETQTTNFTGSISAVSGVTITVTSISTNRFILGELININTHFVEKVKSVVYNNSGGAIVTLDTGHKSVEIYKYQTNASSTKDYTKTVNSSILVEDRARVNLNITEGTRNESIFNFRRPAAPIVQCYNSSESFVVGWTNGATPSIYYQQFETSTGNKIGKEKLIAKDIQFLAQRNIDLASLKTGTGDDGGLVVVWDNETLDLDKTGIYQTILNPNNPLIKFSNGVDHSQFVFSNDGKMGIGTNSPTERLHIKTDNNTCNVLIQAENDQIITSTDMFNLELKNNTGTTLSKIKSGYSKNYQSFEPQSSSLYGFYTLDGLTGDNLAIDISGNGNNARLMNFDVNNCWVSGIINNGLQFNGINQHLDLGTISDLGNLSNNGSFTLNTWIKIPKNISTSANLDIFSNGGTINSPGTVIMSVADKDGNNKAYLRSSLASDSSTINTVVGTTDISDDAWHMASTLFHSGNSAIQIYLDGSLQNTTTISNSISSFPTTSNSAIGSRDHTLHHYRGIMDEFRIYKTALTTEELNRIYHYGTKTKGEICFSVQNGDLTNELSSKVSTFTLDDEGALRNITLKPASIHKLTGTYTTSSSATTLVGTGTLFREELQIGDSIKKGSNILLVTNIESNTQATLNVKSSASSSLNVIRKPSILRLTSNDDILKGLVDYNGNMILGSYVPSSKLELRGTGEENDLPYLTLTNTTTENTESGRETKINFGSSSGSEHILSSIISSHDGTSTDTKGKFQLKVHNGSALEEKVIVLSDGKVGFGLTEGSKPEARLHMKTNDSNHLILTSDTSATSIRGENSRILFQGENSKGDAPTILRNCLSMIEGSSDSVNEDLFGRLDFYTNPNDDDNLGLQRRMCIKSDGKVGVNVEEPLNIFQVAPRLTGLSLSTTATQAAKIITLTNSISTDEIVGGIIVFDNAAQTTYEITGRTDSTHITVDTSATISSATAVKVHYPGLSVNSTGNVSVGASSVYSRFHVEGPYSSAIRTITSSANITNIDSTIICNGSSVTATIPSNCCIKGRKYVIKNINSNGATVATESSQTIDGASTKALAQYKFVEVQSDGANWFIIATNL